MAPITASSTSSATSALTVAGTSGSQTSAVELGRESKERYAPIGDSRISAREMFTAIDSASKYALQKFSDLGSAWSEIKNPSQTELASVLASGASSGSSLQKGYIDGVAAVIGASDRIDDLREAGTRVPLALKDVSFGRQALKVVGPAVDSVFGVLDFAETFSKEGRMGPESSKQLALTVGRNLIMTAAGAKVFAIAGGAIATAGAATVGAPALLGIAAAAGTGYAIGKAYDYAFGG